MPDSVLLIDDDVDVLRAVGMIFERAGYEVARELNAESGLAAYDRLRPEVVILDLNMPGLHGLDALARFLQRKFLFIQQRISELSGALAPLAGDHHRVHV